MVRDDVVGERAPEKPSAKEREAASLLGVQRRLLERFPAVGPAGVRRAVEEAYLSMTGPIRDFVPLLVEHNARDTLEGLNHGTN